MLSDDEILRRLRDDPGSIVEQGGENVVGLLGGPAFEDFEWSWERRFPVVDLFHNVVGYEKLRAFPDLQEAVRWYEDERNGSDTPDYYNELERSIVQEGVIDELSVADLGDGHFDLLDGWHRFALAIKHGLETVPVFLGRLRKARQNPTWFTGRKDDLGLRVHPWVAFDGHTIDSPIWLSPDKDFAKANAGYHGFLYTVEFAPKKLFPGAPLIDYSGRYWEPTPFGREVLAELERGRIFPGVDEEDAFEALRSIDRGDYGTMETKVMVDWLKARGYDAMEVTGDGPVNVAVLDPSSIRVVSVDPATPGHDPVTCRGCRVSPRQNPPEPKQPPYGGTTKRIEKAAIYRHKACESRLGRKVVWRPTFVVDVEKWKVPGKWGPESRSRSWWWAIHPSTGREYAFEGPPQMPCPECGKPVSGEAIKGVKNDAVPCTAKCVSAIGPACECACAGANHGATWGGARPNPPKHPGRRASCTSR